MRNRLTADITPTPLTATKMPTDQIGQVRASL
jgi:hypothetical protein